MNNKIKEFLSHLPPRPLGTPPPGRRGIEIVRISIVSPLNYHFDAPFINLIGIMRKLKALFVFIGALSISLASAQTFQKMTIEEMFELADANSRSIRTFRLAE